MNEWRWDGPDLEDEANTRLQGALMNATMMATAASEGAAAGRQRRRTAEEERAAATAAADRALWRSAGDLDGLGQLDDGALAERWAATARHFGDDDADRVRRRIEAELQQRDPETMRDYLSWRRAAAAEPGEAMAAALREREERLEQAWRPLLDPARCTGGDPLLHGWAAAATARGSGEAARAAAAGEARLRAEDPALMDAYDALRGRMPAADAAALTAGRQPAFGGGWDGVRAGKAAGTAAVRTVALAGGPHTAAAKAAAMAAQAVAAPIKRILSGR